MLFGRFLIQPDLLITGVVFLFYARTLGYSFCIDDSDVALRSDPKKPPKNILQEIYWAWRGIYYRHDKPGRAHWICFIVHWANCLLVYYAFKQFGNTEAALFGALYFAVNPAGAQGSVWLSGKMYLTITTCVLLSFLFKYTAPVFYWLSLFITVAGIVAPLLFAFSSWWWLVFMIPIAAALRWKFYCATLKARADITPARTRKLTFWRFTLYFKSLGYYTYLALFPYRLGVYHEYLYTYGLSLKETVEWERSIDRYFFIGAGVIYLLVTNLIWNYGPAVFGLYWFVLFISLWCNYPTTLQQAIAERYLYLPIAGLMFFVASMILGIPDPVLRVVAFAVVFVAYGVRLLLHLWSFEDLYFQVDHNLLNFPDNYAVWTWKGQVERLRGSYFTALEAWFRGWKLRKTDFRLCNNIAILLANIGQFDEAEGFLKLAGQNLPEDIQEEASKHINNCLAMIAAEKAKIKQQQNLIIKATHVPFYRGVKKK